MAKSGSGWLSERATVSRMRRSQPSGIARRNVSEINWIVPSCCGLRDILSTRYPSRSSTLSSWVKMPAAIICWYRATEILAIEGEAQYVTGVAGAASDGAVAGGGVIVAVDMAELSERGASSLYRRGVQSG